MEVQSIKTEDDTEYCATCRPCCTIPHGPLSAVTATIASIAWIFSLMTMGGCHFMVADFDYCQEAEPNFATCGDCFCANGNKECPLVAPKIDYSVETVAQWQALTWSNPINLTCNPYQDINCETDPPQPYYELFEDAVCAIKYNQTSLNEDECPTEYTTQSYRSPQEAKADGAIVTHYGSCGACSSLQDLAVYVEEPDLTDKGQKCGVAGLIDEEAGISCFERIGFTTPCAKIWMYSVFQTRDFCSSICIDFTFSGDPNNGPPPTCDIAPCLQCDEDESGPLFKKFAARSRRRSGLLSKIARSCEDILLVNHTDPCPQKGGNTPVLKEPQPTCHDITVDVGPLRYARVKSNILFDLGFFVSNNKRLMESYYTTCQRYKLRASVGGFWETVQDQMGYPWHASAAFALMATIVGGVVTLLVWSTTCAAFKQNFWNAVAIAFLFCGIFQFLVLLFYLSDICPPEGCEFKDGSVFACVAGALWFVAAVLAFLTRRPAKPGLTIGCCCCPTTENELVPSNPFWSGGRMEAYKPQNTSEIKIATTETVNQDGSRITEKITTQPDGSRIVETITHRFAVTSEAPQDNAVETEFEKSHKEKTDNGEAIDGTPQGEGKKQL